MKAVSVSYRPSITAVDSACDNCQKIVHVISLSVVLFSLLVTGMALIVPMLMLLAVASVITLSAIAAKNILVNMINFFDNKSYRDTSIAIVRQSNDLRLVGPATG